MQHKPHELSAHAKKMLDVLHKSNKPMGAYELLEKLRKFGVKAPPTVYRALDALMGLGLVHRIESLNAFIACHHESDDHHGVQLAVCHACKSVEELHDHTLCERIDAAAARLKFHIERQMLELMGLCANCSKEKV